MGRRWGAIRPKIAIFKEEKWVCYGAKNLRELRCYNISAGGDATENEDFQKRKQRFIFHGGDLMKNHDFHKGKMVAVGCFQKYIFRMGTMRLKVTIFKK